MKHAAKSLGAILLSATLVLAGAGCDLSGTPKEPTAITIWHYYNGAQQQTFNRLVSEFNETIGEEQNIIVESVSQGSINEVSTNLQESLQGNAGAQPLPNAAALYADSAYAIYEQGQAADFSNYLTKDEIAAYVPAYLDEGRFSGDDSLYLFPVAKSTEIFMLNQTDWEPFAAATGASEDAFQTWEGVAAVAQQYYEWTDAKTPDIPNDGKAFFGRDAMANYLLIGSLQLGTELFSVQNGKVTYQLDENIMRRLWDNFYVPYVNGWFTAVGRFRSDDVKTGDCLALVGSTSGASYFPTEVTREDGSAYPIKSKVYPLPNFAGTSAYAVQQGASLLMLKSDKIHEKATVTFLKWFTQRDNSLDFCLGSGYLPVTLDANTEESVTAALDQSSENIPEALRQSLLAGIGTVQNTTLYTSPAFINGKDARSILENSLSDKAKADRASVMALVEQGIPIQQAIAQFNTDENFFAWLSSLESALKAV